MPEILDIGNTFTRIAEWNGGEFTGLRRLPTCELGKLPERPGGRLAACVCPEVRRKLEADGAIRFISAWDQCSRVDFSPVDRNTLGADRVANAIAAAEFYPLPAVVIDCGTALTMEVVDARRRFVGGAIAPGRLLLRQALASGTAQLPKLPVSAALPEKIGCNTADAITFGVDVGAVGIIRQWLDKVSAAYPGVTVILTGGDAPFFAPQFPEAELADRFFTLHGIRIAGGC